MKQQPNYAVAHAVQVAEQKKARTVAKGTLSLSGHANKRSTDADNVQMPAVAEDALAQAAQALHDVATKAVEQVAPVQTTSHIDLSEIPRVVFRCDVRNSVFVFWVDTMDLHKKTISMLDMTHGSEREEVPVDFYKTLRPMEQKAQDKAVKQLTEKLGINRLVVRSRLLKSHMLERDTEGKVDEKSIEALKANLLQAVEQFKLAIQNA